MTTRLRTFGALALFVGLTVVMTWPQTARLGSSASQHQDVYFNMWRLGWAAHALSTSPRDLFDGNIFYPEKRAMTLSDAMLVEDLTAAPLLWLGLNQVLVHNLLLLGAIAASAFGMFVLARRLTACTAAGIAAGIIFAFAPYRFEHLMHMELQWAMWIPWTFWALDRTIDTARVRDGVMTGFFAGLQMLSSIYYGIFLGTLLVPGGLLLLISIRRREPWRAARALAVGALVALLLAGVYVPPYSATKARVGDRGPGEIQMFSARRSSYLVATPDNLMYGRAFEGRGRGERRLFPGTLAVLLAIVGLLLRKPPATALVYLLLMVLAFEMSLGPGGYSYAFFYNYVPMFSGLRAVARLGLFVLFFVAALAAFGVGAIQAALPRARWRLLLAPAVAAILLLEYWAAPIHLVRYPAAAPPLYSWLAKQPAGVVAEFPMPSEAGMPYREPFYEYMSTFHWKPLVNGYSGYSPPSSFERLDAIAAFPDDRSLDWLRRVGVRYVVLHPEFYEADEGDRVVSVVQRRLEFRELGRFDDGVGGALVYQLR